MVMALQKVRLTVLQRFFRISTCNVYVFTPENPLRLVRRNFCLAIILKFIKEHHVKDVSTFMGVSANRRV